MSQIILEDFNLEAAERRLCLEALTRAGNIIGAAKLLGITRRIRAGDRRASCETRNSTP